MADDVNTTDTADLHEAEAALNFWEGAHRHAKIADDDFCAQEMSRLHGRLTALRAIAERELETHRAMARMLVNLKGPFLHDQEPDFLATVQRQHRPLSQAQRAWLDKIVARAQRHGLA